GSRADRGAGPCSRGRSPDRRAPHAPRWTRRRWAHRDRARRTRTRGRGEGATPRSGAGPARERGAPPPRLSSRGARARPSRLQPEELLDPPQDSLLLALLRRVPRFGVEPLADGDELDAPPREEAADRPRDLGAVLEHLFEALLVEAVALGIGHGHDAREARLAGHEAHLAEEARRRDLGHGLRAPVLAGDA